MLPTRRIEPAPGQESVWDYPRPPRVERTTRHLLVMFNQTIVAETRRALRVMETSSPPTYYFPPADVEFDYLLPGERVTYCEWKGKAIHCDVRVGTRSAPEAAWTYPRPNPPYAVLADHLAFYPGRVDACYVDSERVRPQPGTYYGGWITRDVVGPFKGEAGTETW